VRAILRAVLRALTGALATGLGALLVFVIFQPYAVLDAVNFVVDVFTESYMAQGVSDIPYTRQFIGTLPYLYPLWQMMLWSLGLPLGIAGVAGALAALAQAARDAIRRRWDRAAPAAVLLAWLLIYFGIVGSFHAKFLRYMLPIIPLLCLWAAWALWRLLAAAGRRRRLARALGGLALVVVLLGSSLYALAYLHIYRHDHTWVQATAWICENLPTGSRIVTEHWDDRLPMIQGRGDLRCYGRFMSTQLPVYDPDDADKLETLLDAIQRGDYIVLASNRLYNTIARLPDRYPLTSRYYELLLGEQLGYQLVYYAAEYPTLLGVELVNDTFHDPDLPVPALIRQDTAQRRQVVLGRADESYSVYDHPKPMVFQKTEQLSRDELLALFGPAAANP
jgi:hypothetical protein